METVMFHSPPEWGQRVIKRDNEILLQGTSDRGVTWRDMPIPEFKLVMAETGLRSSLLNPYKGLGVVSRLQLRNSVEDESFVLGEELQSIVDSGSLLSKSVESGVEAIVFLGAYRTQGLAPGQIWRDEDNYLRVAP